MDRRHQWKGRETENIIDLKDCEHARERKSERNRERESELENEVIVFGALLYGGRETTRWNDG